jgi:hypothetical protein
MSTTEILALLVTLSPAERATIRDRLDALDDSVVAPSSGKPQMTPHRDGGHGRNPNSGTDWVVGEDSKSWPWTFDKVVEEISRWPVDAVVELVDRILIPEHGGLDESADSAWRREAQRRVAELEIGQVQGIPLEETLAKARKLIGR